MRTLRLAVLLAVISLHGPTAAEASADDAVMLNIEPAGTDTLLVGAAQAADAYWTRVGLKPICPAHLFIYDDADQDVEARGELGGCRVWVTRRARRGAELGLLTTFCGTITHERGHNIGLTHESGWPIMRNDTDGARPIPTECYTWAKCVTLTRARKAQQPKPKRPPNQSRTHHGRTRTHNLRFFTVTVPPKDVAN